MFARRIKKLVCGEGHGGGVKDAAGGVNERNDQDEFEWVDDVIA